MTDADKCRELRWYGHVEWKEDDNLASAYRDLKVEERVGRDRGKEVMAGKHGYIYKEDERE